MIDDLYSRMDERQHRDILKYIGNYSLASEEYTRTKDDITLNNKSLSLLREQLAVALADRDIIKVLDNRPKSCKDDTCAFVSKAIVTRNKYETDIDTHISSLQQNIEMICNKIDILMNEQVYFEDMVHILSKIRSIIDMVKSNYKL